MAVPALAAALALGPSLDGLVTPPTAGAECTWQRHAKRVVKRLKRNGKVRRVVRKRVWWSCEAAAGSTAAAPAPVPPAPPPSEPEPNRLSVKAAEFFYVLSRPSVAAGEVTIELSNYGEDPHNLNLQRQDDVADPVLEIPETGPQERASYDFELEPGSYRLWCSLPEHDELGMHATLEVSGS